MSDLHAIALEDACSGYAALRPPNRVSVSAGAAENLVIQQPGAPKVNWSADETPYMVEPLDALSSRLIEAEVFVGPARIGKALDVETPIPVPTGWKRMGDLVAGDMVFGVDGTPTTVVEAHSVMLDHSCYEVRLADGESIVADAEHLWGVERFYWKAPNWRYEVRTTESLIADLKYGRNRFRYRIRNASPLHLPEQALVVDPYLLGLWLGNGTTLKAEITSHEDDVAHVEAAARTAGWDVTSVPDYRGSKATRTKILEDDIFGRFTEYLRHLGVFGNKHIPPKYLRASKTQRLSLLRGLMDSDGSVDPRQNSCEFSTTSDALSDGFCELARSLGLKPTKRQKATSWVHGGEKRFGKAWRITFSVQKGFNPFSLPRKRDALPGSDIDIVGYRQIVSIEPVASRPVRCIKVQAADSLFLAGRGFVPTHNTASLLLGWMAHNVVNDPGDMLFVQMSKDKAREFSKTDVDRAIRHSDNVRAMKSDRATDSNTFDSLFRHGMWLRIAWPTVSNVSGSTYRYVAITDIDRIENAENVDGEGPLFDLAKKRTTTFLSRGMTLVESSPGKPFENPSWKPATPHEAPPTGGILSLYNRSDRRRFYWACPDCHGRFEAAPGLKLFSTMPDDKTLLEEVRTADISAMAKHFGKVICPHCGAVLAHKQKSHMNKGGIWVPDGVRFNEAGEMVGKPMTSSIRGYWLGGVAAAYQSWESIVEQHLQGLREYALTGSEEKLKQTTNTDQGMPYMPRHISEAKGTGHTPRDRAEKGLTRYVAPEETRCVLVSVDVQGGQNARFDVQVHAVGPSGEQWVIDRFKITESKRPGPTLDTFAPIDPASYPEDWDVLTDKLLMGTWRTTIPGVEIRPLGVIVDSGGEGKKDDGAGKSGVTHNAYAWMRRVRALKLHKRAFIYKGGSTPQAPNLRETMVGKIGEKGRNDIPLLHCNPNKLSDEVDAGLRRQTPGPGYIHFPAARHPVDNPDGWVSDAFFDELEAEVRGENGTWTKLRARNETFDHCRMIRALMTRLGVFRVSNWDEVPTWFAPLERNAMLVGSDTRREQQRNTTVASENAPQALYPPPQRRRPRRSSVASL